jgi:hypothetical protein
MLLKSIISGIISATINWRKNLDAIRICFALFQIVSIEIDVWWPTEVMKKLNFTMLIEWIATES